MQNILVDDEGSITGVINWECVSTLPLWRSCEHPEFLKGRHRNEEPKRDQYGSDEDTNELGEDLIDNEGVNSHYWNHLLEYELTILREMFLKEMHNIAPAWMEEFTKGILKVDFDIAVQNCNSD